MNNQRTSIVVVLALFPFQLFASYGHSWCWWTTLGAIVWWVVASTLLFFTWNKVVAALFNAKAAKFWQALLLVATLAAFCGPHLLAKKKGRCQSYHYGKKTECPYSK